MTAAVLSHDAPARARNGPKGLPLLGVAGQVKADPLNFFAGIARSYSGIVDLPIGTENVLLLNEPSLIEHVLQSNWRNYRKSDFYEKARPLFGNGLATSEGDFWRRQRRLSQPAFHRDALKQMTNVMRTGTSAMLARWAERPGAAEIDFSEELTRLTLDIVFECLFGSDLEDRTATVAHSVDAMLQVCERRVWAVPDLHGTPVSPQYWRHRAARKALDDIVYDIVRRRRASGEERPDLLGMLLAARDAETGEGMSDDQLRDEVTTLLVTGHESAANVLAWLFCSLSRHPAIERRVREEATAAAPDGVVSDEALTQLPYLGMVNDEVLRLYPPAWTISRTALGDDVIGGTPVAAGTTVMVSPFVMHRNPRYWDNPEGFDPERFTPEQVASRPKYAYFPFGGGPRVCIGRGFAIKELKIVAAMVLSRYSLHMLPGCKIEGEAMISIRPKGGMRANAFPSTAELAELRQLRRTVAASSPHQSSLSCVRGEED